MASYTYKDQPNCLMCGRSSALNPVLGLRLNQRQGWKPRLKAGHAVSLRRCRQCGLTYPDLLPIPGSIEGHYAVPPESYWTEDYFSISEDYLKEELRCAQRLLRVGGGSR